MFAAKMNQAANKEKLRCESIMGLTERTGLSEGYNKGKKKQKNSDHYHIKEIEKGNNELSQAAVVREIEQSIRNKGSEAYCQTVKTYREKYAQSSGSVNSHRQQFLNTHLSQNRIRIRQTDRKMRKNVATCQHTPKRNSLSPNMNHSKVNLIGTAKEKQPSSIKQGSKEQFHQFKLQAAVSELQELQNHPSLEKQKLIAKIEQKDEIIREIRRKFHQLQERHKVLEKKLKSSEQQNVAKINELTLTRALREKLSESLQKQKDCLEHAKSQESYSSSQHCQVPKHQNQCTKHPREKVSNQLSSYQQTFNEFERTDPHRVYRESSKIEDPMVVQRILKNLEKNNENLCRVIEDLKKEKNQLIYENAINKNLLQESNKQSRYRELHSMCSEQLRQYKNQYKEIKQKHSEQQVIILKLKHKIGMLSSLIGHGVMTDISTTGGQKRDILNDMVKNEDFKADLVKVDSFIECGFLSQQHTLLDLPDCKINSEGTIRNNAEKDYFQSNNTFALKRFPLPGYMAFHDKGLIVNYVNDLKENIIKPEFVLLMRMLLDSKFVDYCLHRHCSQRFPEFTYSFLQSYKLLSNQKKLYFNVRNVVSWQEEMVKVNFLVTLFDDKISSLPEIQTFREFLTKNTQEDEIFFYLMCRDKLLKGPQQNNYINCSDIVSYVAYEYAKQTVLHILHSYSRKVKDFVFSHLNDRRVLKNGKQFVDPFYVLRLLLELYKKSKSKKLFKLQKIFRDVFDFNRSVVMKFHHFRQLIEKNYPFLTRNEVCEFYRKTISLAESQLERLRQFRLNQPEIANIESNAVKISRQRGIFFDCFFALHGEMLFLREVFEIDTAINKEMQRSLNVDELKKLRDSEEKENIIQQICQQKDATAFKNSLTKKRLDVRQKSLRKANKSRESQKVENSDLKPQNSAKIYMHQPAPQSQFKKLKQAETLKKLQSEDFPGCKEETTFISKDKQLKNNHLFELLPDCIYGLGNESLNRQYIDLLRQDKNCQSLQIQVRLINLLNSVTIGKLLKRQISSQQQSTSIGCLHRFVVEQITFLNKIEGKKANFDKKINKASTKLGRAFRKQICKFYNSFNDDVQYYLRNEERDQLKVMEKYNFFDRRKSLRTKKDLSSSRKEIIVTNKNCVSMNQF